MGVLKSEVMEGNPFHRNPNPGLLLGSLWPPVLTALILTVGHRFPSEDGKQNFAKPSEPDERAGTS